MNSSAVTCALAPYGVVTKMLWSIAACAGDTAVICVGESTMKLVASTAPKSTVGPVTVKPVPVIVTVVPPAVGPELGDTPVTAGGGRFPSGPLEDPVVPFTPVTPAAPAPPFKPAAPAEPPGACTPFASPVAPSTMYP